MTSPQPRGSTDLGMMWRVGACWARDRPRSGSESRLLDSMLEEFRPADDSTLLHDAARASLPFDLRSHYGWIVGRPLPRTSTPAVPVTTIQLDGDDAEVTRCCIRTAILRERDDGTIEAQGWRFELGEEGNDMPHPYQHAQPIAGWNVGGNCLVHPTSCGVECTGIDPSADQGIDNERSAIIRRVDQSQPAFPLITKTLTGLLAATVSTLYGASSTRLLLENDARLSRAEGPIAVDLAALFG